MKNKFNYLRIENYIHHYLINKSNKTCRLISATIEFVVNKIYICIYVCMNNNRKQQQSSRATRQRSCAANNCNNNAKKTTVITTNLMTRPVRATTATTTITKIIQQYFNSKQFPQQTQCKCPPPNRKRLHDDRGGVEPPKAGKR